MTKSLRLLTGAAALTALLSALPAQTAQAASYVKFRNAHTGLCLAAVNATEAPRQIGCSQPGYEHVKWEIIRKSVGGDEFWMLKNAITGECLDSRGTGSVYLSGCYSGDPGQWWYFLDREHLLHVDTWETRGVQHRLVGWNDRSVSAPSTSTEYLSAKAVWRVE
ncbi:RICIN domain-containing protein [Streptomyces sp. DH37]|uniref:RICIN domain-containing protein n=1 Tax=Streptomyces sp. DH37 TaxID=3040122 RepID=UPI00244244F8|nr:RICIN domain-containing protein [Streptomyces sp. DH37]MDG9702678.1 RICIN domain-containing protein [Streptomyces sp. DH37]